MPPGLRAQGWPPRERARAARGPVVAVLLAGAAAAAWLVFARRTADRPDAPPPLAYEASPGALAGGALRAGTEPASVRFSDGSRWALAPATRGRLVAVDAAGARLDLESGRADLTITPRPGARWSVAAGPFLVTVRGTVFAVTWSAAEERLEVRLRRGRVDVTGPGLTGALALRPGQRLVAEARRRQVHLLEDDDDGHAPTATAPGGRHDEAASPPRGPAASGAGDAESDPRRESGQRRPRAAAPARAAGGGGPGEGPAPPAWAARVRAGEFAAVVADAEARGLDEVLARAGADDLTALADAARYARQAPTARRALLALRRRFAGAPAAEDAAFHLGRLAEAAGQPREALSWYARYLDETPRGPYAADALSRRARATAAVFGPEAARPVAEEYLRRFPTGDWAEGARALARP
jgi:TolA-binding protein